MFKIPTFTQYVRTIHENAREKYGLTWGEVREELPERNYWQEWRDYAVNAYNNGSDFTPQHWASLDDDLIRRVKRTHRYLSR